MGYRKRRNFTEAECVLMWDRWQAGNSLHEIARPLDRGHGATTFSRLFEKWDGLWVPLGLHITMNFAWNLFAVGDGAYAGKRRVLDLIVE